MTNKGSLYLPLTIYLDLISVTSQIQKVTALFYFLLHQPSDASMFCVLNALP